MNGKIAIIVIITLALGLVASLANMTSLKKTNADLRAAAEKTIAPPIRKALTGENDAAADIAAKRILQLERDVEQRDERIAELVRELEDAEKATTTAAAASEEEEKPEQPRQSREDRYASYMERMKEEDPERYKEFQERRERMRSHMTDTLARQSSFVLNMDTTHMTEEQLANHEELSGLLEKNWEYMETIQTEGAPADEVREARMGLMMSMRDMSRLLASERDVAIAAYGRDLGMNENENTTFAKDIQNILDMTSLQSYWGGGWGRSSRNQDRNQEGGR